MWPKSLKDNVLSVVLSSSQWILNDDRGRYPRKWTDGLLKCWRVFLEFIVSFSQSGPIFPFAKCNGMYVYVPLKFMCWNPNPEGDGIWRWGPLECLGMRVGLSWMGLVPLWESPHPLYHVRTQQKDSHVWRGPLPSTSTLDLRLSSLQSYEKYISVVCKPPGLWHFVIATKTEYDTKLLRAHWHVFCGIGQKEDLRF